MLEGGDDDMPAPPFGRPTEERERVRLGSARCKDDLQVATGQELRYPTSLSAYIYGPNDEVLAPSNLETVGWISEKRDVWGIFWSKKTMNGEDVDHELAEAINHAVEENNGEGVINLRVSTDTCAINMFPFLDMTPFWPGCTIVHVEGRVVRRKPMQDQEVTKS